MLNRKVFCKRDALDETDELSALDLNHRKARAVCSAIREPMFQMAAVYYASPIVSKRSFEYKSRPWRKRASERRRSMKLVIFISRLFVYEGCSLAILRHIIWKASSALKSMTRLEGRTILKVVHVHTRWNPTRTLLSPSCSRIYWSISVAEIGLPP